MLIEDVKNMKIIKNYDYYTAIKKVFTSIATNYKIDCKEGRRKPVNVWL